MSIWDDAEKVLDASKRSVWDDAEEILTTKPELPRGAIDVVDREERVEKAAAGEKAVSDSELHPMEFYEKRTEDVAGRAVPLVNAPEAFKAGMKQGEELLGNNASGKAAGTFLGSMGAVGTAFNPLTEGAREIPVQAQAATEEALGKHKEAMQSSTDKREFLPTLQAGAADTGSQPLDTTLNFATDVFVSLAKDPINSALMLAGIREGFHGLKQMKNLKQGLEDVGGKVKVTDSAKTLAERTEQTLQDNIAEKGQPYVDDLVSKKVDRFGSQYKGQSDEALQTGLDETLDKLQKFRVANAGAPITTVDVELASQAKAIVKELNKRGFSVTMPEDAAPKATTTEMVKAGGEAQPAAAAPEPQPTEPTEAAPAEPGKDDVVHGVPTVIRGAKGTEFPATYVAIPRNQVQASHLSETFAPNPEFPLENPRDYSKPEEQAKVLEVRNKFDPKEYVTDSPNAAVGPIMIAQVIDDAGSRYVTLGGNNRKMATDTLPEEKQNELYDYTNEKAEQFGLGKLPSKDYQVARFMGSFDLRQPGMKDRLQGMMDALNPSPGLVQSTAKMAEVDAEANIPTRSLRGMTVDIEPKDAQTFVAGLIRGNMVDRNLRTPISQNASTAQEYVRRVLTHAAFRDPRITEFRQDPRDLPAIKATHAIVDAATPILIEMRQVNQNLANAVSQSIHELIDYIEKDKKGSIESALDLLARQEQLLPEAKVVQQIAGGLKQQIVRKGNKLDSDATKAKVGQYFQDIGGALAKFDPTPDIFGGQDTIEAAIKRGIELNRKQNGTEPEVAMAGEGGRMRSKGRASLPANVKTILDNAGIDEVGFEHGVGYKIDKLTARQIEQLGRNPIRKIGELREAIFTYPNPETGLSKDISSGTWSINPLWKLADIARQGAWAQSKVVKLGHESLKAWEAKDPKAATDACLQYGLEWREKNPRPVVPEKAAESLEQINAKIKISPDQAFTVLNEKGNPYVEVPLRGMDKVKIIQMPEMVRLAKELGAKFGFKKLHKARGYFMGTGPKKLIVLDPRIFNDPIAAGKTLAHEIGHLVDFLPDGTLKRGNLVGRLMSLRKFMKDRFGPSQVSNKDLREELIKLSQYWKPWDPAKVPKSYDQYRKSAEELYADAISVLFNSPATLKEMAPKFWSNLFRYLDEKPEVRQAFEGLQELLQSPTDVSAERTREVHQMFGKAEEVFLRKTEEKKALHATFRGFMMRLKQNMVDLASPILEKQKALEENGVKVSDDLRMDLLFGEHPLSDNKVSMFLDRMFKDVVLPLEAADISTEDLGQYLFYRRISMERVDVFEKMVKPDDIPEVKETVGRSVIPNPLGHTPETALNELQGMLERLGGEKFAQLENAAKLFHDSVFAVVQYATQAGLISSDTFNNLIVPNRGAYATFLPVDYVDTYVPAGIYKQVGTFKEVANPFFATVLKTVTLFRATEYQMAKSKTAAFLTQYFPDEVQPAEMRQEGRYRVARPPKDPSKRLLEFKEDGRYTAVEVDAPIAEMFEFTPPSKLHVVANFLNWSFRNWFHAIYIRFNPKFQLIASPMRDAFRSYVNGPDKVGAVRLAVEYVKSIGAAKARLKGQDHPLIEEMLRNHAIGTPYDSFARGLERNDAFEALLQKFHVLEEPSKSKFLNHMLMRPLMKVLNGVEFYGQVFESLPKIATYKILTKDLKVEPREAANYVRNHIGMPNSLRRGNMASINSSVIPFYNVFVAGWRDDIRLMTKGYKGIKSKSSWWMRWAMTSGMWTTVKAFAAVGLLSPWLKKFFDGVSDYYKTNYTVLPLGTITGGDYGQKSVFIPVPQDETHRLINGILYKGITTTALALQGQPRDSFNAVFDFGAGQVPGLNPTITIADKWAQWMEGKNPTDDFHNKHILSNAEWLAGGWPSVEPMLSWTWDQSGLGNFVKYDSKADTTLETVASISPIDKLLKISDYGFREQQSLNEMAQDKTRAEFKVMLPDDVQGLVTEYSFLRSLGAPDRTVEQELRYLELGEWYNNVYKPTEDMALSTDSKSLKASAVSSLKLSSDPYIKKKK